MIVCSAVVVPVCDIGDMQPNEAGLHVGDVEAGNANRAEMKYFQMMKVQKLGL